MLRQNFKTGLWSLLISLLLVLQVVVVVWADERVTSSETPCKTRLLSSDIKQADNNGGEYELPPSVAGGPKVYNCLAHSLGFSDRWIQPGNWLNLGTATLVNILNRYNYDANMPIPCDAQCFPKVMMIWHVPPGANPNDNNWKHAMRQEADGKWSSKNGPGALWKGIDDPDAFLQRHYSPGSGMDLRISCFCVFPQGNGGVEISLAGNTLSITAPTRAQQYYIVSIGTALAAGVNRPSFAGLQINLSGQTNNLWC